MDRLKEKYQKEVAPALTEKFGYKKRQCSSRRVEKIIIQHGRRRSVGNPRHSMPL